MTLATSAMVTATVETAGPVGPNEVLVPISGNDLNALSELTSVPTSTEIDPFESFRLPAGTIKPLVFSAVMMFC